MTNAERRQKRREAGLKGAATRRARTTSAEPAQVVHHQAEPPQLVAPTAEPPRAPTLEETARRAEDREAKRLANLRAVLRLAQEIRREGDLYYHAHHRRWHHSPRRWTAEQIEGARQFLEKFRRPDGSYDPKPLTRKGRWRL